MKSHTTKVFRKIFPDLPQHVQEQAKKVYTQFETNPFHPGINFKRVHSTKPIYSVRINIDYRALGIQNENEIVWFWIGTHQEYDKMLKQL